MESQKSTISHAKLRRRLRWIPSRLIHVVACTQNIISSLTCTPRIVGIGLYYYIIDSYWKRTRYSRIWKDKKNKKKYLHRIWLFHALNVTIGEHLAIFLNLFSILITCTYMKTNVMLCEKKTYIGGITLFFYTTGKINTFPKFNSIPHTVLSYNILFIIVLLCIGTAAAFAVT